MRCIRQNCMKNKCLFKICFRSFENIFTVCRVNGSAARDRRCKCQKPYYGRFCQYKNDCETDKDCNNQGISLSESFQSLNHNQA